MVLVRDQVAAEWYYARVIKNTIETNQYKTWMAHARETITTAHLIPIML